MKKFLSFSAIIILFFFPKSLFSQIAPNLNHAASFVLFTGNGQFTSNSSLTNVVGDVGNLVGAVSAFPPGTLTGNSHYGDSIANLANTDIAAAYADLAGRTCGTAHGVGFGNGETLTPDTYCATAASTLNGTLTLDAGGNAAAVFIIKIDGTFSAATGSQILLTNQASLCNVYWQINGAVDLNNTVFAGTMLVNGAISLNTGTTLKGRALATTGALIFDDINATRCDLFTLSLKLASFDVTKTSDNNVQLTWVTSSESNMLNYEVEASNNATDFYKAGTVASKGSSLPTQYSYKDVFSNKAGTRFYRIKMIEKNGSVSYSQVKSIQFASEKAGAINVYPNPASNTINISLNADTQESVTVTIANLHGQKVMQKTQTLNKGSNNITEDIHGLPKANYIISINNLTTGSESHQNFQKL